MQATQECRICHRQDSLFFLFTKEHSHLFACKHCGYTQVMNQPPHKELDEIYSSAYFSHSKYRDTNTLNREHTRRYNLMTQYMRGGSKILDYGCAAGEFIRFIGKSFYMFGMDYSENAIQKAREAMPNKSHRLTSGTIGADTYLGEYFDGIVMWDVIEHMWEPLGDCQKLLQFLKPGGYLFISTPNIGSFTARLFGRYWAFMTPPEHLGFFNKRAMAYLFENTLQCDIKDWQTKGKWTNVGFVLYKINRVLPGLIPQKFMRLFQRKPLNRLSVYIPTGDIQYAVIKKRDIAKEILRY